ncbi:MAG: uroporphyrinogen decarboxylase family protein [Negativicutes bacterium]|nr:uroporphyrinogen decarboxylase family protein [Negativicutes bacterium]
MREELTPRERVRMALNHQEPDRTPMDLGATFVSTLNYGAYDRLAEHLEATEGMHSEKTPKIILRWGQSVRPSEEMLQRFRIDTRPIFSKAPRYWRDLNYDKIESFVDEWGVLRQRSRAGKYHYYDVVGHPLSDTTSIDDLEKFRWPLGDDPGRIEGLREEAEYLYRNTQYSLIGNLGAVDIFEMCWFLRGYENALMDLMINEEFMHAMLRKILNIQKKKFDLYLGAVGEYIDAVMLVDDFATQQSLFISPATFRKMLKPYHKELIEHIKKQTAAKILLHTCGAVRPLLPDLIEIGVDAIQPVQVSAVGMDTKELKQEFGDKLVFWGAGCDSQQVLPHGSVDEVRAEVEKRMSDLSPGGGYVFSPVHNIQFDVPPENIVAMFDHAYKVAKRP